MTATLVGYFFLKFFDMFASSFLLLRQRLKLIPSKTVLYDGFQLMTGDFFISSSRRLSSAKIMFFSLVRCPVHALLGSHLFCDS